MLSLTRRVGEEICFSGPDGLMARLVVKEVKGEDAVVFTFEPTGDMVYLHEIKLKEDAMLGNARGTWGSVRLTGLIGGCRARLSFDFPREIKLV